jgi:hypothetical protein
MLSKRGNHAKKAGSTRLAAIRVTEIDDSLEVLKEDFQRLTYSFSGSVTTHQMVRPPLS